MQKIVYSREVKWAAVKDKLSGEMTNKEIMEKHGIKNRAQIADWMNWYKNNEFYRFDQPIGKQYSYGFRNDFKNEQERQDHQLSQLIMENEILKKYIEIKRGLEKKK
ncbi:transposase [Sporosarcina sp. FA9]|uniref:transposase n=1 Tax=Sporosarcina sp. FA9 TaxID=3413030 RepID=UPI003F65AAC7